jgi:hypothetical protein
VVLEEIVAERCVHCEEVAVAVEGEVAAEIDVEDPSDNEPSRVDVDVSDGGRALGGDEDAVEEETSLGVKVGGCVGADEPEGSVVVTTKR